MTIDEEYMLLGKSLFAAQKIEFALYGIAAHIQPKGFEKLTPEIFLQWFDDIENDTATLQWQKTLEQPQPKLEHVALAALQQSNLKYNSTKSCQTIF